MRSPRISDLPLDRFPQIKKLGLGEGSSTSEFAAKEDRISVRLLNYRINKISGFDQISAFFEVQLRQVELGDPCVTILVEIA